MVSNAVFLPFNSLKEISTQMLLCIEECALANEEYITFGILTDEIKKVERLVKKFQLMRYEVELSSVKTIVEDESQTVCFIKVKWHKERFVIKHKGNTYLS